MGESSNSLGRTFEQEVQDLLEGLAQKHSTRVTVSVQPAVLLQNDETVRPDFHLVVEFPYERSHYFIECQDRTTYSKSILHKIQHVRAKQPVKTFVFVHRSGMPPELERAMNAEGVMQAALAEFGEFLEGIDKSLAAMESIPRKKGLPDRAMLSSLPPSPPVFYEPEIISSNPRTSAFALLANRPEENLTPSPGRRRKWWEFWK